METINVNETLNVSGLITHPDRALLRFGQVCFVNNGDINHNVKYVITCIDSLERIDESFQENFN